MQASHRVQPNIATFTRSTHTRGHAAWLDFIQEMLKTSLMRQTEAAAAGTGTLWQVATEALTSA